jgi:Domain of unknown function (DUF1816)
MFESILLLNSALFGTVALLLYVVIKASIQAWQASHHYSTNSEGNWGWWIEVNTASPECLYYFGPFSGAAEADGCKSGYVQDLVEEGACNITANVLWCKPQRLTSMPEDAATSHLYA